MKKYLLACLYILSVVMGAERYGGFCMIPGSHFYLSMLCVLNRVFIKSRKKNMNWTELLQVAALQSELFRFCDVCFFNG